MSKIWKNNFDPKKKSNMAVEETVILTLEDTQEEVVDMIGHFLLALVTAINLKYLFF